MKLRLHIIHTFARLVNIILFMGNSTINLMYFYSKKKRTDAIKTLCYSYIRSLSKYDIISGKIKQ